jgi:hypothetical protein
MSGNGESLMQGLHRDDGCKGPLPRGWNGWIMLWIAFSFLYYFWMFLSNLIKAL